MGTSNPLHGQSSLSNIGVFYYVIKNLKNVKNICHANNHLLCLAYSQDLRVYGFNPVLDKFADDINKFEREYPIIGKQRIYVQLCQVTCENLALNGIFGFLECFAWDFFILSVMQNRTYKQNLAKIYLKNEHEFDTMLI